LSSVIEMRDIKKDYYLGHNVINVLKGVNLTVYEGELLSLMGASGAGKSTLMNIIGLLDHPTSGTYNLDDRDVSTLSDEERSRIRNLKIGFVFQSFFLLPRLNALQNVEMPLVYRGVKPDVRRELALERLEKVGMKDLYDHKPNQLSGGQMQRVAIARALVGKPSVILADEPTGALDSKTTHDVMQLLKHLNKDEGATIIIITHDSNIAQQCQHTVRVVDGLIETKS